MLHLHNTLPVTFGGVARYLLCRIIDVEGEVVLVSDKYVTPTIKDCERETRASTSIGYKITGPSKKRPSDWIAALRNSKFKESLITVLLESWMENDNTQLFRGKTLFVNNNDLCKFYVQNENVCCEKVQDLYCSHEEAGCFVI